MKKVNLESSWPQSWQCSYSYDLLEVYEKISCYGYAYAYDIRCKHTIELIQKVAQPQAKILDVAAAQGNFSLLLAELGYEVTWNDIRSELIDYVKLKHEYGVINFVPGDIFKLDFDAVFDVVLIGEVIEHVAHPDDFLKNISRLIRPNGHIVMTTPNGGYFLNKLPKFTEYSNPSYFEDIQFGPNSDDHIFLLHLDEVYLLAQQADLTVTEAKLFTNPLSNGHLKLENLLRLMPKWQVYLLEKLTCQMPTYLKSKLNTGMAILLTRSS